MSDTTGDAYLYLLYVAYKDGERLESMDVLGAPPALQPAARDVSPPETPEEFSRRLAGLAPHEREAYVAELQRGYGPDPAESDGVSESPEAAEMLMRGEVPREWRDRLGPGRGLDQLTEWLRTRAGRPQGRTP